MKRTRTLLGPQSWSIIAGSSSLMLAFACGGHSDATPQAGAGATGGSAANGGSAGTRNQEPDASSGAAGAAGSAGNGSGGTDAGLLEAQPGDAIQDTAHTDGQLRACVEGNDQNAVPRDPEVRNLVTGANGSFQDSCDEAGNLIEYWCEFRSECEPGGPNPSCHLVFTGQVLSETYDCSGKCSAGTCRARCPDFGDHLIYRTIDAAGDRVTFENQTDKRMYDCTLFEDTAGDTFDCRHDPRVGDELKMVTQGIKDSFCTGKDFGNLGVGELAAPDGSWHLCGYTCSIL